MSSEPSCPTLVEVFEQSMERFGSRPLFGIKRSGIWVWVTYAEFASLVARFRAGLSELGIGPGDRVAILSNNRLEWAVAAHAAYGLAAAIVPMYEAQHASEWAFILHDSGAKALVVAHDALLARLDGAGDVGGALQHIIVMDRSENTDARVRSFTALMEVGRQSTCVRPDPGATAGVIYTSGTTGKPKGVLLSHSNMASNIGAAKELLPRETEDCSLSFLPWAHVFGQTAELHGLLSVGGSMAICPDVSGLVEDLREVRPTVLFGVPLVFNRIYTTVRAQIAAKPKILQTMVARALEIAAKERAGQRLSMGERAGFRVVDRLVFARVRARLGGRLQYAVSGGAALSKEVAEFIDSLGVSVYEGYGLTETSPIVTTNVPGARKLGSVGRPIPGVRVEIDPMTAVQKPPENGKPARWEGEVIVYGHNVMSGYLDRPAENAAVFTSKGGLRTGDMGYVDPDGYLFITGRVKEQYKLENGKYVVPTPLEEALKLSAYVLNAMVYGENRPFNVAIVVADLPAVRRWAEDRRIEIPAEPDALLEDERIRALFEGEVEQRSGAFRGFEAIHRFALVPTDFTTENGLLTPSMKLKRAAVIDVYRHLIDELYIEERRRAHPTSQEAHPWSRPG